MTRLIALMVALALSPVAIQAEEARPQGLLWSETDLPRTFPLVVKTAPGGDYLLVLRDLANGQDVLGAYIRGGEFFRVLVPPGSYSLQFAAGIEWQGEQALFGERTRRFVLDPPLRFGVEGVGRKQGNVVDLRDLGDVSTKPIALCQRFALNPEPFDPQGGSPPDPQEDPFTAPEYTLRSRICD
ncbi:hypothetical protein LZA78_12110 [Sinirhodobacter sp. WL0062]|uniref:DUF2846 domain-containing protein n=1 Tax=Rhodobacter flavimaris TaxID=2907145 RepID=A0ABS8YWP1_9RHOB|nr:hypothetical protein [Sinirhodobacter sp. WL0062]MCE5974229.1 hypothetical protein [Sinirhodobacter sp. WL0062]